jgi:hypothetical protein
LGFTYIVSGRGQRREWRFLYRGAELAPYAQSKATALLEEERGLRRALAACRAGEPYSGRREDIDKFKRRLQSKGEARERCELLARELTRAGEREFELALDDLVYFGLDAGITSEQVRSDQPED